MPADAPAAVAAFDDVEPFRFVAGVGVVVAGEKIAVAVEGQRLRVAQARVVNFQIRAVGVAAEDAAAVLIIDDVAFGFNVRAAVAHAEIQAVIRAHFEAVKIVAHEGVADAVAIMQRLALGGVARVPGVFQQPQIGNVRQVNAAFARENSGGDAVEDRVETRGIDRRKISLAFAGAVFHQLDALAGDAHFLDRVGSQMARLKGIAVIDRARVQIFVEPVHVAAIVDHALADAESFGDVEAAFFVDGERDDVRDQRLGGEQLALQVLIELEFFDRHFAFVGRGKNLELERGLVGLGDRRASIHRGFRVFGFVAFAAMNGEACDGA